MREKHGEDNPLHNPNNNTAPNSPVRASEKCKFLSNGSLNRIDTFHGPTITEVPREMLDLISSFLDISDIVSCSKVSFLMRHSFLGIVCIYIM